MDDLVEEWVDDLVEEWVDDLVEEWVDDLVEEWVDDLVEEWMDNYLVEEWVDDLVEEWVDDLVEEWVDDLVSVYFTVANGVYQNSVYGISANLPNKYTIAVVLGSVSSTSIDFYVRKVSRTISHCYAFEIFLLYWVYIRCHCTNPGFVCSYFPIECKHFI